jgi:hypothetical protein
VQKQGKVVEKLRSLNQSDKPDVFRRSLMEVETALKHFIFGLLTTTAYKAASQAEILQQLRARATQAPPPTPLTIISPIAHRR